MSRALAHLALHAGHGVAGLARVDEEHAGALAAFRGIGDRRDGEGDAGFVAVGDELLAAVEHVAIALAAGGGAEGGGIRTGLGLGQEAGGDQFAGNHPGQVLLLLHLAAEAIEHVGHAVVDVEDGGEAGVGRGELLDGQAVFGEGHARTAGLHGNVHAEEAEFGHRLQFVARPGAGAVAFGGRGGHYVLGHLAGGVADHDFLLAQECCGCIAHMLPLDLGRSSDALRCDRRRRDCRPSGRRPDGAGGYESRSSHGTQRNVRSMEAADLRPRLPSR
ncbi:hypothetical protein D3C84_506670 [compost metagenome]